MSIAAIAPAAPEVGDGDPLAPWRRLKARGEREFDQHVPGLPGDGTPVVLHVDAERELTFTWHDISRREQDWNSRERGYLVSRLSVTDITGAEVGGLSITHTTAQMVADELPSAFMWADENIGHSFGFAYREVTPRTLWADSYEALSQRPASAAGKSAWRLEAKDAPDDPWVLATELSWAQKQFEEMVERFVEFLSVPFVDYSHLDLEYTDPHGRRVPLRGTGVGQLMYVLAAQQLGRYGRVLRASGLRSELAMALWERMQADPTVPTRQVAVRFWRGEEPVSVHWCIDFTGAVHEPQG